MKQASVYPSAEVKNLKHLIITSEDRLAFEIYSPRAFVGNFQWSLFYKYFQNFVIAFIPTWIMEMKGSYSLNIC